MRPTKQETNLEYWSKARAYWAAMKEAYWLINDAAGEARCEARHYAADLCHKEALGEIIVYTGRAAPRRSWAPVWQ